MPQEQRHRQSEHTPPSLCYREGGREGGREEEYVGRKRERERGFTTVSILLACVCFLHHNLLQKEGAVQCEGLVLSTLSTHVDPILPVLCNRPPHQHCNTAHTLTSSHPHQFTQFRIKLFDSFSKVLIWSQTCVSTP